ncbi:MAG: hypothetical protein COB50_05335 [Thiotrichales bacterium]|nr:MAG: hypothetical protein COB50_05335 [Thiotrichales bacterium]
MFSGKALKKMPLGLALIRSLNAEGMSIFSTGQARELADSIGLKNDHLVEALYHLRQIGWIVSLHRGLYAISTSLPGVSPVHEFEVAMALVNPAAISHWSAFHVHELT